MFLPITNSFALAHLAIGWGCMSLGVASGAIIGLFFHRKEWLGVYGSVPRRMFRLGHISFFGMGALNMFWAGTLFAVTGGEDLAAVGSLGLILATASRPPTCFYCGVRGINRALFVVPVTSTLVLLIGAFSLLGTESRDLQKASPIDISPLDSGSEFESVGLSEGHAANCSAVL